MKLESIPLQRLRGGFRRGAVHLVGGAVLVAAPSMLAGQTAPRVIQPPTREEVTRPGNAPPAPRSRLDVEGGIDHAPCALEGPEFRSIHFVLRGAEFDGLQGMTRADLGPAYSGFIGRDVPISTVCEVRDRAAQILQDAGYIAAVQVPEQRIEDGIIHFQVVMAHLTQVRVRGEASGAQAVLGAYFRQLTKRPLFNRYEAERYLLLASDVPGYTVRLTLRPAGTAPGDVVGDVTVQHLPAYVDFIAQNGGSDELGPWGGMLRGQLFGLTGLGDRTLLSVFSSADLHEQQTVQLGHDMRIGPEGLTLGGTFTYASARPSEPTGRVLAKTLVISLELGYPLIRRQQTTLRGSAGLDVVNQDVWFNRVAVTRDRLRVGFLRLGLDAVPRDVASAYSTAEPPWHLASLLELRHGLDALGATDCGPSGVNCLAAGQIPPSRIEGRADATVVRFVASAEVRPMPKFTFALGGRAQHAWQPLFSFEYFSAGNYTVGRGYDPGALLGDSGFGTQAEIRYGSRIPVSASKPAVEGYAFWDHAHVSHQDGPILLTARDHLDSVGAGARADWNRFFLDAAIAVPLTRLSFLDGKPPVRVLFSLTTRLWPWKY